MGHPEPEGIFSRPAYPPGSTIKLLIAYDGADAATRATNLRHRMAIRFDREFEIETVTWNFTLLKHPHLCKEAARQAAAAEMVIVAPDCSIGLPEHAWSWLKGWLCKRSSCNAALVALLPLDAICCAKHSPVATNLSRMAANASLDFFYSLGDPPTSDDRVELSLDSTESGHHEVRSILLDLFNPPTLSRAVNRR